MPSTRAITWTLRFFYPLGIAVMLAAAWHHQPDDGLTWFVVIGTCVYFALETWREWKRPL